MKLTNYFVILILSLAIVSCNNKREEETEEDVAMRVIGEPQAIEDTVVTRDTTIKIVEETIEYVEEVYENVESASSNTSDNTASDTFVDSSAPTYASSTRVKDDNYNKGNSGFFDKFLDRYKEQGEKALQPTPSATTKTANQASKFNQEKEAIAKSLDDLERKNKEVLETYERIENQRKEYNEKVLESSKAIQKAKGGAVETIKY